MYLHKLHLLFLQMISTEAQKIGLRVVTIRPTQEKASDYYVSKIIELEFEGAFVQVIAFLKKMSEVKRLTKIQDFTMTSKGNSEAQLVPLAGRLEVEVFRYKVTDEDTLLEKHEVKSKGSGG